MGSVGIGYGKGGYWDVWNEIEINIWIEKKESCTLASAYQ